MYLNGLNIFTVELTQGSQTIFSIGLIHFMKLHFVDFFFILHTRFTFNVFITINTVLRKEKKKKKVSCCSFSFSSILYVPRSALMHALWIGRCICFTYTRFSYNGKMQDWMRKVAKPLKFYHTGINLKNKSLFSY